MGDAQRTANQQTSKVVTDARAIAASVEATARDIQIAAQTYQQAPKGSGVRRNLLPALDQLHERLSHQLIILCRKHKEDLR
jgi:hypothetical protein